MISIYVSDLTDKRMIYALDYLRDFGYEITKNEQNADYILPPVTTNPRDTNLPYMAEESFLVHNAVLTAEAAICVAKDNSDLSLINAPILIVGYGRIAKALHHILSAYSSNITVCARNSGDRAVAQSSGANVIAFDDLKKKSDYSFVFNTVPHPVFNDLELKVLSKSTILIDLASFPGGVDKHLASVLGVKLIEARGLPGKYSPKSAGKIIAVTTHKIIKEGKI